MNSKDIIYLYDETYVLGGISKYTGQVIGIEGSEDFKVGKIYPDKIKSANRTNFKNKNILDIGFGRGEVLKYCFEHGAKSCVGIDYSPDAYKIASNYLKNIKVKLYNIAITEIDKIKENNFEVIYILDVLEHVSNKEWFICFEKLKFKLTENCVLIAKTPAVKCGDYLTMHNNYQTKQSLYEIFDKYFQTIKIEKEGRWFIIKCRGLLWKK